MATARNRETVIVTALFVLALAWVAVFAQAPVGTPTSKFVWDQPAPTLAEAQGYTYRIYADGATTGTVLAGVTCVAGASGFATCQVPFPAFTPGGHSVQFSAANAAGESAKSSAFAFTLVVIPGAPSNVRIVGG